MRGSNRVKCNARFWNRQPHLSMPQLCIARNFLFRRGGDAFQKIPPLWYDLFRSKPVFLQKVVCKLFFCRGVKNRSSNSKCNQRQCRDQECCKWVRAKRSKKIPARRAHTCMRGSNRVKCNARFWNRQPHLSMPQLCIARNFLFRRGGDAFQKIPPLWYDLFRSKPVFLQKVV